MKEEVKLDLLGRFIEYILRKAEIGVNKMTVSINMSKGTLRKLKKGYNRPMNDYLKIARYYYDTVGKEEFMETWHRLGKLLLKSVEEKEKRENAKGEV